MSKKTLTKITSALIVIFLVCVYMTPVFADIETNYTGNHSGIASNVETIGQSVLGVVEVIAGLGAIILLLILGIKYMTASPEGKAEVKKTAIIYVVGAFVLFGASWILQVIKEAIPDNSGTGTTN